MRGFLSSNTCLLALSLAISTNAYASDTVELDDIQVVAPSVETTTTAELSKYGSEVNVVTREQIERAGASADITRVLQKYVPGFYVAPKAGPFDYARYSLMGGSSTDTLILLDGVRLNNGIYGGMYLDTIPTAAVDRIEILKGGQSLFFGTNAVSGVINIVTKRAISKDYKGQASIGFDTFKGLNVDGDVQKVYTNGLGELDVLAFGSRNVTDGYQAFRDEDYHVSQSVDKKRSYDATTVGLKLGQKIGSDKRLEVFYQYTNGDYDYTRPVSVNTYNAREHQIASTTWTHKVNDWFDYFVKGHLNAWDTDYTRVETTAGGGFNVMENETYWGFREWGAQAQGKIKLPGDHEWVLGVDSNWGYAKDGLWTAVQRQTLEAFGYYTQFRPELKFLPDFHPAFGIRHETMNSKSSATIWNVSGIYDLADNLSVRGQVGTSFKRPAYSQLFLKQGAGRTQGNPGLDPEESLNYELGVDYENELFGQPFNVSATGFYRKIDNKIGSDGNQYQNLDDETKVKGFSVNAEQRLNLNWAVGFDYTRTLAQAEDARIVDTPASFARVRVNYDSDAKDWGAELGGRYIGSTYSSSVDNDYGEYAVFDGSAYYFFDEKQQHKLSLMVENIFDREYGSGSYEKTLAGDRVPVLARPLTAEIRYTYKF